MEKILYYLFGVPSFTLDWIFRAISVAFVLFLFFGLIASTIKRLKEKSLKENIFFAFSNGWEFTKVAAKIVGALLLITILAKDCSRSGYKEPYIDGKSNQIDSLPQHIV